LGEKEQKEHDYLYWEFVEQGGKQGIRKGDWKAVKLDVKKNENSPIELYNLQTDPGETQNVADQNPEIVKEMDELMKNSHQRNLVFPLLKSEIE